MEAVAAAREALVDDLDLESDGDDNDDEAEDEEGDEGEDSSEIPLPPIMLESGKGKGSVPTPVYEPKQAIATQLDKDQGNVDEDAPKVDTFRQPLSVSVADFFDALLQGGTPAPAPALSLQRQMTQHVVTR